MNIGHAVICIEKCRQETDLGVTLAECLIHFDMQIQNVIIKANQIIGILISSPCKIVLALVIPHLEYGNSVWSLHLKRQFSAV